MKLRWLVGNFADPAFRELDRSQQHALSNEAHSKYTPASRFILWTALAALPAVVAFLLLPRFLGLIGFGGSNGAYAITTAVIIAGFWIWVAWVYGHMYVAPMRRTMRAHGYDLCMGCGYDLMGLGDDIHRCPECGREREPPDDADAAASGGPS